MPTVRDLVWSTDLPRAELAARLGVTARTLTRYCRQDRAPYAVRQLLEIYAGRVPWRGGERLIHVRGALYAHDGADGVPLIEIPAYGYRLRELDSLWRELRTYRAAPVQYLLALAPGPD